MNRSASNIQGTRGPSPAKKLTRLAKRLGAWLNPPPICAAADLREFLNARAAFVAQKSINAYCQMKTRMHMGDLMREEAFRTAYERARWLSYGAVLADLVVIAEGLLRSAVPGQEEALAAGLGRMAKEIATAHGAHGEIEAVVPPLIARLELARSAPPRAPADIAQTSADTLFAALPIHPDLRRHDGPSVMGGVRFLICSQVQELERRLRPGPVAAALIAGPAKALV